MCVCVLGVPTTIDCILPIVRVMSEGCRDICLYGRATELMLRSSVRTSRSICNIKIRIIHDRIDVFCSTVRDLLARVDG